MGLVFDFVRAILEQRLGRSVTLGEISDSEQFELATLGMVVAASRYDPERRVTFGTYATRFMWGYVSHERDKQSRKFNDRMSSSGSDDSACRRSDDPAEMVAREEIRERVLVAVRRLPPHLRSIIQLRLSGRDPFEIAADLGETKSAIFALDAEAKQRLRELLSEYEADYGH
jgi:RNA polymerase sigma factor (sigma-70 family)